MADAAAQWDLRLAPVRRLAEAAHAEARQEPAPGQGRLRGRPGAAAQGAPPGQSAMALSRTASCVRERTPSLR
jgi:hypothetical protein